MKFGLLAKIKNIINRRRHKKDKTARKQLNRDQNVTEKAQEKVLRESGGQDISAI